MHFSKALLPVSALLALSSATGCPFADPAALAARGDQKGQQNEEASADYLAQFEVDDSKNFMTSDVGGPIEEQNSLKAGARGPTLLEDFIFRQKIQHFDHERVRSNHLIVSLAAQLILIRVFYIGT